MIGLRRGAIFIGAVLIGVVVGSISAEAENACPKAIDESVCPATCPVKIDPIEEPCPAKFDPPPAPDSSVAKPGEEKPINLGWLKERLKLYHQCSYEGDVSPVFNDAKGYIEERAATVPHPEKPLAVVLDIDETALSNWVEIVQNDFGYFENGDCTMQKKTPCGADAWIRRAEATAIKPALDLFNTAIRLNVAVFFVTGRFDRAADRMATITNLTCQGFSGWKELVMRNWREGCDTNCYKREARAAIDKNYEIIANIGDQWSDLDPEADNLTKGSYAERIFKVPNPFYFIPCRGDAVCAKAPYTSTPQRGALGQQ